MFVSLCQLGIHKFLIEGSLVFQCFAVMPLQISKSTSSPYCRNSWHKAKFVLQRMAFLTLLIPGGGGGKSTPLRFLPDTFG